MVISKVINLKEINQISGVVLRYCGFHTSMGHNAQAGKAMRKIMGYSSKRRRGYSETNILPTPNMFSKGSLEGRYSGSAKRASVLNKLFMRHITDLMATGEYSSEFLGHGIEINRVQITPDYKGLNIFWVAKGTQDDELVEKILKKNAGFLRHELSTLRVMGVVPTVQFVKDKQFSQIIEIDSRLAKADFGDDYVPIAMETKLKTQLELHTPLPSNIRDKIQKFDEDRSEDAVDYEDVLPPMPQDVFGLNHSEILNRIGKSIKKSEAAHRLNSSNELQLQRVISTPLEFSSNKEQRTLFKSFLDKRELLRLKTRKLEKNYLPDLEYMKEEMRERHNDYFKKMDIYEEENDYVSDYEDDNK